jgi:tight adherence protein B
MNLQAYYPYAIYIFAAAAAIFLAEAFYLAAARLLGHQRSVNRRLQALGDGMTGEQVLIELKRERGIGNDTSLGLVGGLKKLLIQSGLRLTMSRFLLRVIMISVLVFAVFNWIFPVGEMIAPLIGVLVGVSIPLLVLRVARSRRQSKFIEQLPDALDVIVRSLRSGHPVPVALAMVGREMPDPIGSEFGITVDEMTYGLDTEQALQNLYHRVGHPDISMLVTAVSLQTSTGGNLSEILKTLAKIIRDRFQLRRKVRSLSAEGKISAYGMTVMPILLAVYINIQNPDYYGSVWNDPVFLPGILAICVWALIGDFIMFKMINFKY